MSPSFRHAAPASFPLPCSSERPSESTAISAIGARLRGLAALVLLLLVLPAWADECFVKPDNVASGNGSSWSSTMPLGNALGSTTCAVIYVARGVYKPGPAGHPEYAFIVRNGTRVYGGFYGIPGTERDMGQRDPLYTPSVLSGDIDSDDPVDQYGIGALNQNDRPQFNGTNSYRVVVMDGTSEAITAGTVLDGFAITGGKSMQGGGLVCDGSGSGHACSPTLANLQVVANSGGVLGGGLSFLGRNGGIASPRLSHITFRGNSSQRAGALYFDGESGVSEPVISNATFTTHVFGAVWSSSANTTLLNSSFTGNAAPPFAAIYVHAGTLQLRNVLMAEDMPFDAAANPQPVAITVEDSILTSGCPSSTTGVTYTCTRVSSADPMLGPLRDNGGTTLTMLPQSGSPAIDSGNDGVCITAPVNRVDQRGVERPQRAHCDIGAVEARQATLNVSVNGGVGGSVSATAPSAQSGGISGCTQGASSGCSATYAGEPAVVTLRATPPSSAYVVTWGGVCRGYTNTITVALGADPTNCTATFSQPAVWTVQSANEAPATTSNDCTPLGGSGGICATLRDALNRALNGDIIRFAPSLDGATITLTRFVNDAGCLTVSPSQCSGSGNPGTQFGPSAFFISGKNLTIDAVTGMSQGITVARDPAQPPFRLFDVDATAGLDLRGLTLRNGLALGGSANAFSGAALGAGGAIFNQGALTIDRCTFVGNQAIGGDAAGNSRGNGGGGVGADASSADLNGGSPNGGAFDFQFGLPRAGGFGGGGSVALAPSGQSKGGDGGFGGGGGLGQTNSSSDSGFGGDGGFGGGAGGGIGNNANAGTGTPGFGGGKGQVNGGGAGAGMGGAIFNDAGTLNVRNTTFTGNSATGGANYAPSLLNGYVDRAAAAYGGAIFNYAGSVELSFVTLHGNRVAAAISPPGTAVPSQAQAEGGAIYSLGDSLIDCSADGNPCVSGDAKLIFNNSIAAGSTRLNGTNGAITASSDIVINRIHDGSSASSGSGNLVGVQTGFLGTANAGAPRLSNLRLGGGLVSVMVPAETSAAYDAAANCGGANGIDQQGRARPQGGACDSGAVERDAVISDRLFADGFGDVDVPPPSPLRVQCSGAERDADVLIEDFGGTNLGAAWTQYTNGGTVTVNNGVALASSTGRFPYIASVGSPIPATGDFSVRWQSRYTTVSPRGTGTLVLSAGLPGNDGSGSAVDSAHAWQDSNGYSVFARTGTGAFVPAHASPATTRITHDVEYCWVGGQIEVWVDGALKLQAPNAGAVRPTSLWFGNPVDAGSADAWTGFTLDHVYVRSVNP